MNLDYYRKLRIIDRLSMVYKTRRYNLMEHQYMVLAMFRHFASIEDVSYDMNVLDIVMHHDMVEVVTGDLIWPVKKFNVKTEASWGNIESEILEAHYGLKRYSDDRIKLTLTPLQFALFKACDTLDLYVFCKEEVSYGNGSKPILDVITNCENIIASLDFQFKSINQYMKSL